MVGGHTRGTEERLKFIFLKNKLIIDFLDVGQVEVRLRYEKGRLCRINLAWRVRGVKIR